MSKLLRPASWEYHSGIDLAAPYVTGEPAFAASSRPILGSGHVGTWRVLSHSKMVIILAAIAGIGCGFAVTKFQRPLYEVRATMEIQDLNDNFLNIKQIMPLNDGGATNVLSDVQTQIKILQSDKLLKRIILRMSASNDTQRDLLAQIVRSLKVRAIGQTRLIEITTDSSDAQLAAQFLNQMCQEFIDQSIESRLKVSQGTGEGLERLLEGMQTKLRQSETALQTYAHGTGIIFTSERKNIPEEKLRQLQDELSKGEANRVAKQSRYEMARGSTPEALPDVLNDSTLRDYETKLTELRRQRADVATTYTAETGKVKRLDAQIATLEAALHREQQNILGRIQNEYKEAERRQVLLTTDYAQQVRLVSDLADRSIQYNILQHQVESNRQLYDAMLQRAKDATIASAMQASNIRVIDQATPPNEPYSPKPSLNYALGFAIFSLGAALLVLVRERGDATLREPGDGSLSLQVPELGVLLHDKQRTTLLHVSKRNPWQRILNRLGLLKRPARKGLLLEGGYPGRWAGGSPIVESLRSVATSILFLGPNGMSPRLVAISSAGANDGKTTVLTNIGLMLAQFNRRVLLIDGDVRRGRLHELFGLPNDRGLTTLLRGNIAVDGELGSFVQATWEPRLFVLSSGPSFAGEHLLHTPRLREILQTLKREYDVVLVDEPPLLQVADARILSRIVDEVVLVVRSRHTTVEGALVASQRLFSDGARLLGMVLNDWDPKRSLRRYYGFYGREYNAQIEHIAK